MNPQGTPLTGSKTVDPGKGNREKDPAWPLVTVVTVVYNGESTIEATVASIVAQTYQYVEYIIIDGASKDSTLGIIQKYAENIDIILSEPDRGIYDAMNKGVARATGEWIIFMNGGDRFFSPTVLEDIFQVPRCDEDVLYGNVIFHNGNAGEMHVEARDLSEFWKGMCFVHQSCMVKTALMKAKPYDTSFRIAGDYKFLFDLYTSGKVFVHLDMPIARFESGGLSDNNPAGIEECARIVLPTHRKLKHKLYFSFRWCYCLLLFRSARMIGQKNYAKLRLVKHKILKTISHMI